MMFILTNLYNFILSFLYDDKINNNLLKINKKLPIYNSFFQIKLNNRIIISGVSLMDYSDKICRDMIHALKYTGDNRVVKILSDILKDSLLESLSDRNIIYSNNFLYIIPIPLSKKRLKNRGFNQLKLLLDEIGKSSKDLKKYINYDILEKIKETESQTNLTRTERLNNIKGVFNIKNKNILKDAHIILIDDVLTTGATVTEASKILFKFGAKEVEIITLARVV